MDEPDTERAREQYRAWAPRYDRAIHNPMMRRVRADAVRALDLTSGATVLDVACGTGASFGALQAGVGPGGRIIGVMAYLARGDAPSRVVAGSDT